MHTPAAREPYATDVRVTGASRRQRRGLPRIWPKNSVREPHMAPYKLGETGTAKREVTGSRAVEFMVLQHCSRPRCPVNKRNQLPVRVACVLYGGLPATVAPKGRRLLRLTTPPPRSSGTDYGHSHWAQLLYGNSSYIFRNRPKCPANPASLHW